MFVGVYDIFDTMTNLATEYGRECIHVFLHTLWGWIFTFFSCFHRNKKWLFLSQHISSQLLTLIHTSFRRKDWHRSRKLSDFKCCKDYVVSHKMSIFLHQGLKCNTIILLKACKPVRNISLYSRRLLYKQSRKTKDKKTPTNNIIPVLEARFW